MHGIVEADPHASGSTIAERKQAIQRAFEAALTDDKLRSAEFRELRAVGLETWLGPMDAAA